MYISRILSFFAFLVTLCFSTTVISKENVSLVVLGVAQDAGYPQMSCYEPHCMRAWKDPSKRRLTTSLAVIDKINKQKFLFEATPDIKEQLYQLHKIAPDDQFDLAGIFLTHAHMGHYTGLMHFGREAAGTKDLAVYVMPRMADYLSTNGPWSQLVKLKNIQIKNIKDGQIYKLNSTLKIVPLLVPHRDEFTETVGYKIIGPNKTTLFIPDIDKWQKWSTSIVKLINEVDFALIDATFYASAELPNRNMNEIPHPFVEESMRIFSKMNKKDKQKVIFIHFNHSNPLLIDGSNAQKQVIENGFRFAKEGMMLDL